MKLNFIARIGLGIATELAYASAIIIAAFLISALLTF